MKNFYLSLSVHLVSTACSQGQQGKGLLTLLPSKRPLKPKRSKSKTRPLLVTRRSPPKQNSNRLQKDEIVSFTFLSFEPISSDLQDMDLSELKEIYQEELEHSDIYKA